MGDMQRLLERAASAAPSSPPDLEALYRKRDAHGRRSRITALVVALAIAVGGTAVAAMTIAGTRGSRPAAGGEIGSPTQDVSLGSGEYYYMRFDGGWGVCGSWWALDDSGRLDTVVKEPGAGNCWGPMGGTTYAAGDFSSDSGPVAGLSTDPDELMAQLRDRTQPDGASPEPYDDWGGPIEWGLIRSVGELLEAPDVTPAQKAALMAVAVDLSTSVDLAARDQEGRPAILITLDSEHQMHRWWFDPESHQPLVVDGVVFQASGIADSMDRSDLSRSFFRQIQP
jgi:hypothetical protein